MEKQIILNVQPVKENYKIFKKVHIVFDSEKEKASLNTMKLFDYILYLMEENVRTRYFDYRVLKNDTTNEFFESFINANLYDNKGQGTSAWARYKTRLAIEQRIETRIETLGFNRIEVDFEKFVVDADIPSLVRGKNKKIRFRSSVEEIMHLKKFFTLFWTRDSISDDYSMLTKKNGSSKVITDIQWKVNNEFVGIEELTKLKIRDKKQYIEKLIFTFSPEFYLSISSLHDMSMLPNRTICPNFKSAYSFKLNLFIRYFIDLLGWEDNSYLSFKEGGEINLNNFFGVDYTSYGGFKNRILNVAINEISTMTDLNISITERKEGKKVVGVYFNVNHEPKNYHLNFSLEYYIAVQHYYFSKENSLRISTCYDSFENYLNYIENFSLENPTITKNEDWDKTISDWKYEKEKEIVAYQSLVKIWVENERTINEKNKDLMLDTSKLCITLSDGSPLIVYDEIVINTPSRSLEYLNTLLL